MIHWLVETPAAHPELEDGICPDGLLNAAEQRHLRALRTPKRRSEWLLGRWTAKRLLQTIIYKQCGAFIPLDHLTILNTPSGAPVVSAARFENVTISISHRAGHAFGAARIHDLAHLQAQSALGADIDLVEPRPAGFADDYFTRPERDLVYFSGSATRDLFITAIWAAKEAALKAARLGLTVDTRALTCWIEPVREPPLAWTPFRVSWDEQRLGSHAVPAVQGWWRAYGAFVLTLAAGPETDASPQPAPVDRAGALL